MADILKARDQTKETSIPAKHSNNSTADQLIPYTPKKAIVQKILQLTDNVVILHVYQR